MTEQDGLQEQSVASSPLGPILYTNASTVTVGTYDLTVALGCESRYEDAGERRTRTHVGTVAMSHSHAWVLACLMLRQLSKVVERNGMFAVPAELVERLGFGAEYKAMAECAEGSKE